jgi:hypothetical protein
MRPLSNKEIGEMEQKITQRAKSKSASIILSYANEEDAKLEQLKKEHFKCLAKKSVETDTCIRLGQKVQKQRDKCLFLHEVVGDLIGYINRNPFD